jgi:hypothetical protein
MAYYAFAYAACALTLVWAVMAGRRNLARGEGWRWRSEEPVSLPFAKPVTSEKEFSRNLMRLGQGVRETCGDRPEVRSKSPARTGV